MGRYNVNFELSIDDMQLIEDALRRSKSQLSSTLIETPNKTEVPFETIKEADASVRAIHELLGRLHNQKVFFRPKDAPYVGG